MKKDFSKVALIIPAYQPTEELVTLVNELLQLSPYTIVIINDGSDPGFATIFDKIKDQAGVIYLKHATNQGKGAALKTGFSYCLTHYSSNEILGVVSIDADGQHKSTDIDRIITEFQEYPQDIIIGTRSFVSKKIPFRSRFGNKLTGFLFRKFYKLNLRDTQSGLRAIPRAFLENAIKIDREKYDYEFEFLLKAMEQSIKFREINIETIYINENTGSHFKPVVDSMRIYSIFFRFASVSILSAMIDFLVFFITFHISNKISVAIVLGRLVSGVFNFIKNRNFAFKVKTKVLETVLKYMLLAVALMIAAYCGISELYKLGVNIYLSKILVESTLYFFSFYIQTKFIFPKGKP